MMNKTTVLVAFGSNKIRIPCMFFKNIEEGLNKCEELFGKKGIPVKEINDNPFTNFGTGLEENEEETDGYKFDIEYDKETFAYKIQEGKTIINKNEFDEFKKQELISDVEIIEGISPEIKSYGKNSFGQECKSLIFKFGEKSQIESFRFTNFDNIDEYILVKYKKKVVIKEGEHMGLCAFKSYYDGCGGIYMYYLTEVENNEPFLPFSLD